MFSLFLTKFAEELILLQNHKSRFWHMDVYHANDHHRFIRWQEMFVYIVISEIFSEWQQKPPTYFSSLMFADALLHVKYGFASCLIRIPTHKNEAWLFNLKLQYTTICYELVWLWYWIVSQCGVCVSLDLRCKYMNFQRNMTTLEMWCFQFKPIFPKLTMRPDVRLSLWEIWLLTNIKQSKYDLLSLSEIVFDMGPSVR